MKKLLRVLAGAFCGLLFAVLYYSITSYVFFNLIPWGEHFATMAPSAWIGFAISMAAALGIFFLLRRKVRTFAVSFLAASVVFCVAILVVLSGNKFYY